ncbi:hypothetical protein [Phenylobacterium sp.]|uniref:hypothetical protein n=1 Tax=Phenylobacterium sp. TaxID=1871053 RepID=UPI0035AF9EF2
MALWTPAGYGSALKHWYDAADGATITEVSGKVSAWADKSGNGYHLAQATAAKRGTLTAANANFQDMPTIALPSGGGMVASGHYGAAALLDAFACDYDGYSGDRPLLNYNGVYVDIAATSSDFPIKLFATMRVPSTGIDMSTTGMFRLNGSAKAVYYDDGNDDPTSSFTVVFCGRIKSQGQGTGYGRIYEARNDEFTLGNRSSDWSRTADIDFAELHLIDGYIADADIETFEGYLAWKWGLQGSLPGGHPYKAAAPQLAAAATPRAWGAIIG